MVRELANESHGVCEDHAIVLTELDLSRQRVERGEQSVFDEYITCA